jgi:ketosteroid isomerase-like protein
MSRENVEVVRKLYQGWARGDFSVGADLFHPDIEFVSDFGVDRVRVKGRDAMRAAWGDQLRNWDHWHTGQIHELRELGDCVLAISPIQARGRRSGAEVEMPDAATAFRFQEGKIVWMLATDRVDTALEAVGLAD